MTDVQLDDAVEEVVTEELDETPIECSEELENISGVSYLRVGSLAHAIPQSDLADAISKSPLFDAGEFKGVEPYGWTAEVSNTDLDSYFTHMLPSSLKNYAADAMDGGVPFQHAHDPHSMPIGRSLSGRYFGGTKPRTTIDFYSYPGIRSKDITSDDFMRGVKAGIFTNVSVGFHGGSYVCDLCGRDLMTYECHHFPGMKYPKGDGEGKKAKGKKDQELVVATAGIDDAHLAEVSTVYHGATPGAVILKARGLALAGELRPETATLLEARYRIALPRAAKRFSLGDVPAITTGFVQVVNTNEENTVESDQTAQEPEDERVAEEITLEVEDRTEDTMEDGKETAPQVEERIVERVVEKEVPAKPVRAMELVSEEARADLASYGVAEDMDAARAVGALMAHIRTLAPMAEDGKAYREYLIEEGSKAAVRAFGADTDVDRYKAILGGQSVETIRIMTEDWDKKSGETLKGGRQTVDGDEPVHADKAAKTPSRLFAV